MTPEGLLTFFGLIAAAYALIPPERKLQIRTRLSALDWVILGTALLVVHYITFFPVLDHLGVAPHLGPWRYGFTPDLASYMVLLAGGAVVAIRGATGRVKRTRLPEFQQL